MRKKLFGIFLLIFLTCLSLYKPFQKAPYFHARVMQIFPHVHSEEPSHQILHMLDQEFTYFAKGHDMYAFLSEDQNYVLKIPRKKMQAPFWASLSFLPASFRREKQKKLSEIHRSFQRARRYLPEQSGMIYLHFGSTKTAERELLLKDQHGTLEAFDLDTTPFYLQRKFTLFGDVIDQSIEKEDVKAFRKRIAAFFEMIGARHAQGMKKTDQLLWRVNYGFQEPDLVTEIDLGGLIHERDEFTSELTRYGELIRNSLQNVGSSFQAAFDQELEKALLKSPREHLISRNRKALCL